MKPHSRGPVVLVIWDGFGIRKQALHNPPLLAKMPTWHALQRAFPNTLLKADGEDVGLPKGQIGNSEAGHATIGAGRPVLSDQVVIDRAIANHSFENNPALLQAAAHCIRRKSTLHLMGLLTSTKSGHASPRHVKALINFARGLKVPRIALHLFTDGRDTSPFHALVLLRELEKQLSSNMVIGSLMGRFYAMDRNRNWERTALAYEALVHGRGIVAESAEQAITQAYNRGESDEFILPTIICKNKTCVAPVLDHDAVVFWNLRSDRARQLAKPFVMQDFIARESVAWQHHVVRRDLQFVTLTEFESDLDSIKPAFPHREIQGTLVEALRYHRQLYAAESEKFSQMTYFFDGGYDRPRFNEDRLRVPSLNVARFDERPEMRAHELAQRFCAALDDHYDFAAVNFANADMVGHTGNEPAAIRACEVLDEALALVWKKVKDLKGTLLVTSDHGNVEIIRALHGGPDTEHNPDPVPFLVAGNAVHGKKLRRGTLADVAPTILRLLDIEKPKEMTGRGLI